MLLSHSFRSMRFPLLGILLWFLCVSNAFSQTTFIALGDSLTEGVGDDQYDSDGWALGYPGRLLQSLQNQGDAQAVMINRGVAGYASWEILNGPDYDPAAGSPLALAEADIAQALAAGGDAMALVWVGSNNLWGLYSWVCDENSPPSCAADWVANFRDDMDAILSRLSGAGARLVVALLDDHSHRPVALNSDMGISASELPLLSQAVQAFNAVIVELAGVYGAGIVDFYNTTIFENAATLAEDGNHPNGAGYDIIAGMWLDAVNSMNSFDANVWVNGVVSNVYGANLCALVIANGAHQFTCEDPIGSFQLYVPLDAQGQVTLFSFVVDMAPWTQVLTPTSNQVTANVQMQGASSDDPVFAVDVTTQSTQAGWARASGNIYYGAVPVCALALLNGQHQFTCGESVGLFDMNAPLDSAGVLTLMVFADGFLPYLATLTP